MIKKVLIAGLFLGGGYYFINKILPNFTKKEFQADTMSIEERLAEEERLRLLEEKKIKDDLIDKYGTSDITNLDLNKIIGAVATSDVWSIDNFGIPYLKEFDGSKYVSDGKPLYKYEDNVLKHLCKDGRYLVKCA